MSCGEHSREASSINTLLSLSPSLIFSPFYHWRSLLHLSMGCGSIAEAGRGRTCGGAHLLYCVCFGCLSVLCQLCWCSAIAAVGQLFGTSLKINLRGCNLFTLEEAPTKWDANIFCQQCPHTSALCSDFVFNYPSLSLHFLSSLWGSPSRSNLSILHKWDSYRPNRDWGCGGARNVGAHIWRVLNMSLR